LQKILGIISNFLEILDGWQRKRAFPVFVAVKELQMQCIPIFLFLYSHVPTFLQGARGGFILFYNIEKGNWQNGGAGGGGGGEERIIR
jgi:hypothetical protein